MYDTNAEKSSAAPFSAIAVSSRTIGVLAKNPGSGSAAVQAAV